MGLTDLKYLKDIAAGDAAFVVEMIELFRQKVPEYVREMQQHLDGENWPGLRDVAHTLKPNIDYMGISDLKEVVRTIERNAKEEQELDRLPELVALMKNVCDKVVRELEGELKKLK